MQEAVLGTFARYAILFSYLLSFQETELLFGYSSFFMKLR